MSLIDDTCDFCNTEFDAMGNDAAQNVEGKMWCGHCNEFTLWYNQNMTGIESKAAAYDELTLLLAACRRAYWNPRPEYTVIDRHMVWIDVEDGLNRIQSKYGLRD